MEWTLRMRQGRERVGRTERVALKHTMGIWCGEQTAGRKLLQHRSSVLSDDLEGGMPTGREGTPREGTHGYLWLIHVGQQKQTQHS